MSKRRVFDIDFPDDEPAATDAPQSDVRRGPMASAIGENASALQERHMVEEAIRAENDRLAHEHVRLKKQGLITDLLPIDQIKASKLARDRKMGGDDDLQDLKTSIRDVGLSNPIQVEQTGDGYELIQGYRRLSAYRELFEETGDELYATIPAGLSAKGEALEVLYRRMVDENLVRRDISFAEMAELARGYMRDPDTDCKDVDQAVAHLFGSANRQKRSYIRHFVSLLDAIGHKLKFPETIPRALGLQLEKHVAGDPAVATQICNALGAGLATTPQAELAILKEQAVAPKPGKAKGQGGAVPTAKTTFRYDVPAGTVRCAALDGRVEMRINRDFSNIDRHRLERAVEAFFRALEV